jgi:AcrR family transcriptional regulator
VDGSLGFAQQRGSTPGSCMSEAQRSRKRNRSGRERQLIPSATRLFASRGYDATTTREIAALAGCAEGLIHRYFKGKAGLLFALIRYRVSQDVRKAHLRFAARSDFEG